MKAAASVVGDKALVNELRRLPRKVRNKIIRQSTREAMKRIVLPTSREFAPVKTGRLSKSLRVRVAKKSNGSRLPRTVVGHSVVWTDSQAYYGTWQELGSKRTPATRFLRDGLHKNSHLVADAFRRYCQRRMSSL